MNHPYPHWPAQHQADCMCFVCLDEFPSHQDPVEKIRQDVEDDEVGLTTRFLAYAQRELFRRAT